MRPTGRIDRFAIRVLRVFAWVNLAAGVGLSLLIFHQYGIVFVAEEELLLNDLETVLNPVALTFSVLSLFLGILGWALCLVVAHLAENMIALRKSGQPFPLREDGGSLSI